MTFYTETSELEVDPIFSHITAGGGGGGGGTNNIAAKIIYVR